ncbi:hypothetical protein Peur_060914 [Populus x canadensis]
MDGFEGEDTVNSALDPLANYYLLGHYLTKSCRDLFVLVLLQVEQLLAPSLGAWQRAVSVAVHHKFKLDNNFQQKIQIHISLAAESTFLGLVFKVWKNYTSIMPPG